MITFRHPGIVAGMLLVVGVGTASNTALCAGESGGAPSFPDDASQPATSTAPRVRKATTGTGPVSEYLGNAPNPHEPDTLNTGHIGNLFSPPPGKAPDYWDGLEAHLSVQGGIAGNPWTRSGRNFGQFYTDRANTLTLNQVLGSISHPVTAIGGGYGIGFVAEILYGSDARFDPTIGMADKLITGLYQIAPTQAHIDLHAPWLVSRGIDFQIGQIYGLLGAEGTPALARPLYTFNYASAYIVPFETVGVLSTIHLTEQLDGILGVDAGNSTTFGGAGNNSRPKGYIGLAFAHMMNGKLDGHVIGHFGPQGNNGPTRFSADGWTSIGIGRAANSKMLYNGDVLLTYHFSDRLAATLNATYMHDDITRDDAYGVTSYLAWDINPSLRLNLRGEIFRDNTGTTIAAYTSTTSYTDMLRNAPYPYYIALPTTYGALTVGVTYKPEFVNRHIKFGKFQVRPEIRLDKSLNGTQPFNRAATVEDPVVRHGTNNMLWFSCDAVWSF
ncbi:hypothetical protein AA0311_1550 [Asaia bogorensis NBRC 16594]|uniref:Outer membrane beta-barrel protein n=3 Tax=Asaia TaxID=91914 RepID=A0AAN4U3C9_9PROT|nr:hypothetical protein AA0311_1550 [Asaia bogorensis NBRC 16594]GEL54401.1 hypothetical protein ABO01nite_24080 [Asaia bogorensis NBRC 16594]